MRCSDTRVPLYQELRQLEAERDQEGTLVSTAHAVCAILQRVTVLLQCRLFPSGPRKRMPVRCRTVMTTRMSCGVGRGASRFKHVHPSLGLARSKAGVSLEPYISICTE
jgi:hypothetical protein